MTLTEAFKEGAKRGIIDWTLRVDAVRNGIPKFYIHPANASGVTLDFELDEAVNGHEILIALPHNEKAVWPE